jgi:hypothetical protein
VTFGAECPHLIRSDSFDIDPYPSNVKRNVDEAQTKFSQKWLINEETCKIVPITDARCYFCAGDDYQAFAV